jgi:hypothetical protein
MLKILVSENFLVEGACCSYQDFLDANMETTEPMIPFGKVEVITSKILRSTP